MLRSQRGEGPLGDWGPLATLGTQPEEVTPAAAPSSGLDIAALVAALVFRPAGLVIGIVALSQARRAGKRQYGLAIAGTVIGGVSTLIGVIALIVSLVAIFTTLSAASNVTGGSDALAGPQQAAPAPHAKPDPAAYCAAYAQAKPALDKFIAMDPPDVSPVPGTESSYLTNLALALERACG